MGGWGRELVMRQRVCEMCECVGVNFIAKCIAACGRATRFPVPQLHCAPNTRARVGAAWYTERA